MGRLSNIPLKEIRRFLKIVGCNCIQAKGDHEKWVRQDLLRPIILQQTKNPVPEFIVKNMLRDLKMTTDEFLDIFSDAKK